MNQYQEHVSKLKDQERLELIRAMTPRMVDQYLPHTGCGGVRGSVRTMTPCIEWHYIGTDGYGKQKYQGRQWRKHRLEWTQKVGPIPEGMIICHTCDNPPCYNIDHLFIGTHKDNAIDRGNKGRARGGHPQIGMANGCASLTDKQVKAIRRKYASGGYVQMELAAEYGISQSQISAIITHRSWKHLP